MNGLFLIYSHPNIINLLLASADASPTFPCINESRDSIRLPITSYRNGTLISITYDMTKKMDIDTTFLVILLGYFKQINNITPNVNNKIAFLVPDSIKNEDNTTNNTTSDIFKYFIFLVVAIIQQAAKA